MKRIRNTDGKLNSKYFLILFLFLFLLSCSGEKFKPSVQFYYWKSNANIGTVEQHYFKELHSNILYLHFFDVDKEGGNILPKSILQQFDTSTLQAQYVPVIFVTNRTLFQITSAELNVLTDHIIALISIVSKKNAIITVNEIQIDCDWTENTKEAYFQLLRLLAEKSTKQITATLRLHQIKDKEKVGIPPVKKMYLMCYATSNPKDQQVENSILDLTLLKSYLSGAKEYPLPFDVVLPLYSWAVVTNHLGNIKLINGVSIHDMQLSQFEEIQENTYRVKEDHFFKGLYLNKNFTLRIEEITPTQIQDAKKIINSLVPKKYDIIYYHLDSIFLNRFTLEELMDS